MEFYPTDANLCQRVANNLLKILWDCLMHFFFIQLSNLEEYLDKKLLEYTESSFLIHNTIRNERLVHQRLFVSNSIGKQLGREPNAAKAACWVR